MVTGRLRDEEIIATGGDGHGRTRVSDFDRRMDALAVPFAKTAGYLTSAWPVLTVYDVASTFLNEGAESGIRSAAVETAVLPAGNAGARLGSRIPGPPWVKAIGGVVGGLVGAAVPVVAERAVPRAIEPSGGTLRPADEEDGLEKWFQSLTNDRRDAIRAELESLDADKRAERLVELYDGRSESSARQAAKGGKKTTGGQLANFLATDKVPPTIFGIPVVTRREDYTEADLRFFSEHPEAGGYYSMGDEETPEDGSEEGAPVQADMPIDDSVAFTMPLEGVDKKVVEFKDKNGNIHYRIGHGFVDSYWKSDGNGGRTKVQITKGTKELDAEELAFAAKEKMKDVYAGIKSRFKGSWGSLSDNQKVVLADLAYHGGNSFSADNFIADLAAAAAYRANQGDLKAKDAFYVGRGYRDRGSAVDPVAQVFANHVPSYFLDNGTPILSRVNARIRKLGLDNTLAGLVSFKTDDDLYRHNKYTKDVKTGAWSKLDKKGGK